MTDPRQVYVWRVRTRLPERFGQRCVVLARGKMNNQLVRFEDGYEVITSRNYTRRAPSRDTQLGEP
jgi:hypothetical protein